MTIIATILAVMLWPVDSAAALKCNGYGCEIERKAVYAGGNTHNENLQGRPSVY